MATMPVQAHEAAQSPEVSALFDALGVDEIVLCTPEGHQVLEQHENPASHDKCEWCQSFASVIVPQPESQADTLAVFGKTPNFRAAPVALSAAAFDDCRSSRAPPGPI